MACAVKATAPPTSSASAAAETIATLRISPFNAWNNSRFYHRPRARTHGMLTKTNSFASDGGARGYGTGGGRRRAGSGGAHR
jgi:hypothetical protein